MMKNQTTNLTEADLLAIVKHQTQNTRRLERKLDAKQALLRQWRASYKSAVIYRDDTIATQSLVIEQLLGQ